MEVIEDVRESALDAETLREKRRRQRLFEIDAHLATAIEKGVPLQRVLTHPAGLMGKGSNRLHPRDSALEVQVITDRYNELAARFEAQTEFQELDAVIATEVASGGMPGVKRFDKLTAIREAGIKARNGELDLGPIPRTHTLKAFARQLYEEDGVKQGWLAVVPQAELVARHEANLARYVEAANQERIELGLPQIRVVVEE